jgi:SAM-dependent methyltransferase
MGFRRQRVDGGIVRQAPVDVTNHQIVSSLPNEQIETAARAESVCLLCGGELEKRVSGLFDTRFGIKGSYEARRCLQCGLEQLSPVPTPAELKSLYESHYNFGGETGTLYTRLRELLFSSFFYRLWIWLDGDISFHGRRGNGRLLDVGCNEGRGLKIYARNGFHVEGLELNETAAAVARQSGFIVHTCDLGDLKPSLAYDVAVLSNVLEHSLDPRQMLLDVGRNLKPGGRLWVSCPNSQSWLRNAFGRFWINWHVPFHISQFSPRTVKDLLEETGFTAIEIDQATPALWVSMSMIAKLFAKEGLPTRKLRNPILVISLLFLMRFVCFPALWFHNRLGRGDCLLVTATKA